MVSRLITWSGDVYRHIHDASAERREKTYYQRLEEKSFKVIILRMVRFSVLHQADVRVKSV